jgi:hypothetical protein
MFYPPAVSVRLRLTGKWFHPEPELFRRCHPDETNARQDRIPEPCRTEDVWTGLQVQSSLK